MITRFIANGIVTGSLIAIMAMGFSLIYSTTSVFHIAHGAVYTAGAYAFYSFAITLNIPFVLSFLIAIVTVILLGILIEWAVYAPLNKKNASMGVVFISSLAVYILVVNLIALFYGNETKVLSSSIERSFNIGNVILTKIQIIQIIAFLFILFITTLFFRKTRAGKTFQAMSNNPLLLTVLGTNMNKMRIFVFAIGSVLAGIASILTAIDVGIDPHIGMPVVLNAAIAMIIGGVQRLEGAGSGGLCYRYPPEHAHLAVLGKVGGSRDLFTADNISII